MKKEKNPGPLAVFRVRLPSTQSQIQERKKERKKDRKKDRGVLTQVSDPWLVPLNKNTLQRHNTENSKQIFPGKELWGLSPNFHIHVSESDLYISMIRLPILQQEI